LRRVAIVGAGMTCFRSMLPMTPQEMVFEAVRKCLNDAGLSHKDVQAIVTGSAPDAFDGYHHKGSVVVESFSGAGKPVSRVYVGGGTGVGVAVAGWWHVASGAFDRVLLVAWEKMSHPYPHAQPLFKTIFEPLLEQPLGPNLIWIFALEMRRYMEAHKLKKELIAEVAVKNKGNALDHPYAQLGARIIVEDVLKSPVLVWPVNRLDISPTSDGAVALMLASEEGGEEDYRHTRVAGRSRGLPRQPVLDQPRPRLPLLRLPRRATGLQDGGHHQPVKGDRYLRTLRPVHLQRATPPRRVARQAWACTPAAG
jgi:acetyl-CoA C-acetyltransferase